MLLSVWGGAFAVGLSAGWRGAFLGASLAAGVFLGAGLAAGFEAAGVVAGFAVVVAAAGVSATCVGLREAGGQSKGDEGEKRFHVSSGTCFCMLGRELPGGWIGSCAYKAGRLKFRAQKTRLGGIFVAHSVG